MKSKAYLISGWVSEAGFDQSRTNVIKAPVPLGRTFLSSDTARVKHLLQEDDCLWYTIQWHMILKIQHEVQLWRCEGTQRKSRRGLVKRALNSENSPIMMRKLDFRLLWNRGSKGILDCVWLFHLEQVICRPTDDRAWVPRLCWNVIVFLIQTYFKRYLELFIVRYRVCDVTVFLSGANQRDIDT